MQLTNSKVEFLQILCELLQGQREALNSRENIMMYPFWRCLSPYSPPIIVQQYASCLPADCTKIILSCTLQAGEEDALYHVCFVFIVIVHTCIAVLGYSCYFLLFLLFLLLIVCVYSIIIK